MLVEPLNVVCTVGHITACYSKHDSDILLTHRRLGPKSDSEKKARIIHSAQHRFTRFWWFPILTNLVVASVFGDPEIIRRAGVRRIP